MDSMDSLNKIQATVLDIKVTLEAIKKYQNVLKLVKKENELKSHFLFNVIS